VRLANEVIALGLVRPLPPAERAERREAPRPARDTDGAGLGADRPDGAGAAVRRGAGQPNGIGPRSG